MPCSASRWRTGKFASFLPATETAGFDFFPTRLERRCLARAPCADVLGPGVSPECAPGSTRRGKGSALEGYAGLPTWHKANAAGAISLCQWAAGPRQAFVRRGARGLHGLCCRKAAIRRSSCLSCAIRARSMSMCIRPRPKCGFAILASCAGFLIGALKQSLQAALHRALILPANRRQRARCPRAARDSPRECWLPALSCPRRCFGIGD